MSKYVIVNTHPICIHPYMHLSRATLYLLWNGLSPVSQRQVIHGFPLSNPVPIVWLPAMDLISTSNMELIPQWCPGFSGTLSFKDPIQQGHQANFPFERPFPINNCFSLSFFFFSFLELSDNSYSFVKYWKVLLLSSFVLSHIPPVIRKITFNPLISFKSPTSGFFS